MNMIRQRQKALKALEVLTFKKYWAIHHKNDINNDNSPIKLTGLQNWFRQFKPSRDNTSDSNQESQRNSQDEEYEPIINDTGLMNPLYVSLVEATV